MSTPDPFEGVRKLTACVEIPTELLLEAMNVPPMDEPIATPYRDPSGVLTGEVMLGRERIEEDED